ncbi:MAG: type III-B CRISPR-associated protein Cas10/Cmr2 [Chloroflexi bacterium]|nr:type III-B CRISPR-associated protein Cas10/Cmr2 [Chloroflexota bacterium]
MSYLFLCSLGPVQDFIATARRSRDLWYGSWMLSELAKTAARAIANQEGQEALIFPAPENIIQLQPDSSLNVANKVVALISSSPQEIGRLVFRTVSERLEALKQDAFNNIHGLYKIDLANKQINDLVEYYWTAVHLKDETKYSKVRSRAESLLTARKNTRDFKPFPGDYLPKSSLDGSRESVIEETSYPNGPSDPERENKIKRLYQKYHARSGERLSGVDLLKRLGKLNSDLESKFSSTSHFAALPYINRIGPQKYNELLIAIADHFTTSGWDLAEKDGTILYESRIPDWVPTPQTQELLRKKLVDELNAKAGKIRPGPYYAMLAADGDNMGRIIDAQTSPSAHRALSIALSKFADQVSGIIGKHQGCAIYCGGDDILAYLPLHTALGCAAELERTFRENVNFTAEKEGTTFRPTLSAGLVLAHHLTPLSDVLDMVRMAEKNAKNKVKDKNGLAVILDKRNGPSREIHGKWQVLDARLNSMISLTRVGAFSKGTAYDLQKIQRLFGNSGIPPETVSNEAYRIITRKRESGSNEGVDIKIKEAFESWLKVDGISAGDLSMELIIASMFADAMNMANGDEIQKTNKEAAS